jgi:hypothetical protein
MDGPAPNAVSPPAVPQLVNTVLWITDDSPASNRGDEDASPKGRALGIEPPSRGSVFRIVDFPPDKVFEGSARKMMEELGGGHALDKGKARHALFHKTHTVDYAIVLEGEIWAMLDEGETLMRPGDVLIQRGTNHSWSNRTDQSCRIASELPDRFYPHRRRADLTNPELVKSSRRGLSSFQDCLPIAERAEE